MQMMAAAKPTGGRSLYIQNGDDTYVVALCVDCRVCLGGEGGSVGRSDQCHPCWAPLVYGGLPHRSVDRCHSASLSRNNQPTKLKSRICYDIFYGTRKPAVMYLPCLFYPKNNAKATNLENWCKRNSHTFVCADYYGVARSSGG